MAEFSLPRAGHASGVVTDGEYELLARLYGGSGVHGTPADTPLVFGDSSGMQVKVRENRFGLVEGRLWGSGTTETTRAVGANSSGQTRVDRAVLRLTRSTPIVALVVKAGTPGAGPPALTQDATTTGTNGTFEIPVAKITVVDGASTITAGNVVADTQFLGDDLYVVKTEADRPAPAPGRKVWVTDSGKEYTGNGSAWVQTYPVVVSEDSGNVPVGAASGWALSGGWLRVRKLNGFVVFDFNVSKVGSPLAANVASTFCSIPDDYRPTGSILVPAWANSGLARVQIAPGGSVQILNHSGMAAGGFVCGEACWVADD